MGASEWEPTAQAPAKAKVVLPEPTKTPNVVTPTEVPQEINTETTVANNVLKTDALQKRIDARNKAGLVASSNPYYQAPEDVGVVQSEGQINEQKPIDEQLAAEKEKYWQQISANADGTPAPTQEAQKASDEKAKQSEIDNQKVIADNAEMDAAATELAKNWVIKTPLTQDDAFAIIKAGGKLEKTPESAVYEARYASYTKTNSLPSQTIATLNAVGDMNQWALEYLQQTNPEKYAEVMRLTDSTIKINNINGSAQRLFNKSTGKTTVPEKKKSEGAMEEFVDNYNKSNAVIKDLTDSLTDGTLSNMVTDIAEKDARIEEMQDEIDMVYDDYRWQFPTVPKSILMGMTAAATKDMNRSLNTMIRSRNVAFATYTAKKDDINTQIQFAQNNMNNSMDFLWKIYDTTKTEEVRQEDFARADKLLAYEIARADKKDQQRIKELQQARMDNLSIQVAWLGWNPSKFNTFEWLLAEAGRLSAGNISAERKLSQFNADTNRMNATQSSAADWREVPDWKWGSYLRNMETGAEWRPESWTPSPVWNTPTGKLVSVNTGNKDVQVDEVAAPWLSSAIQEMKDNGIYVVTGKANRDQVQTIKEMADRYWVLFNQWNPAETADELSRRWHIVARPWYSNHEGGMAIDMYSNPALAAPSKAQIDIMAKNWWAQWDGNWPIKWDLGHFTFVWTPKIQSEQVNTKPLSSGQRVFRSQELTRFDKQQKDFLTALDQYRNLAVSLTEDPTWVSDLGSVYQFMKTLDPSSVVRESEFAIAAKASGIQDRNTITQYKNWFESWVILTWEQRNKMLEISKKYVERRSERYDNDYDSLVKTLKTQWITDPSLLPNRASDFIKSSQDMDTSNMTDDEIWANS